MADPVAPGRERRTHRRGPLAAPMWLVVGGQKVRVSALNVSIGGAAVCTAAEASVGEMVALEVTPARSRAFVLDAKVVRVERGVLGLRFLALGQRALEALLEASGISGRPQSRKDDPSSPARGASDEVPGSSRGL